MPKRRNEAQRAKMMAAQALRSVPSFTHHVPRNEFADLSAMDGQGNMVCFGDLTASIVLIVNVASS